ncbi:MAG: hypothetical protein KGV56_04765 [Gammaproteobacteria bacterium]|nr:hypothetical protein [Gammaproteobacteria bacterium]
MINPKELMIGNYVYYPNFVWEYPNLDYEFQNAFQITGIHNDNVDLMTPFFETGESYVDVEEIKPIKITPEWLERLGFKFQSKRYFVRIFGDFEVVLEVCQNRWCLTIFTIKRLDIQKELTLDVSCIHQLQNAIALMTDAELTLGGAK